MNSGPLSLRRQVRSAVPPDQFVEDTNDVGRSQTPCTANRQSLPCELIDDGQALQRPTVDRLVHDEVIAPDMVRMLGSMHPLGTAAQHLAFMLLLSNL